MKYLVTNSNDPKYNLAFEEYCFNNLPMNDSYLFFWINHPSIIIGKNQNTLEEINSQYIKENNIDVVRRVTGGGAVYHDYGNVNFSIITSSDNSSDIDFKKYNISILKALNELNLNAELSGRNDLTINNKKFSGIAQSIRDNRVLNHGTLLFDSKLDTLTKALVPKADKLQSKGIKSIKSRVTNIKEYLDESITMDDFQEILMKKVFEMENSTIEEYKLSDEDLISIDKLAEQKYNTWEWNYGYSPQSTYKNYKRFPFGSIDIRFDIKDGVINNSIIYGDFFGSKDILELTKKLNGTRYFEEDIINLLKNEPINEYFGKATIEDITKLIIE